MDENLYSYYRGQYRFGMLGEGQDLIVERYLKKNKTSRVLHLGSSSNPIINRNISSLVDKVVCADLPLVAINLKAHNILNVTPVGMNILEIPFRDNFFDFILAIGLYPLYSHIWPHPSKTLEGIHRVISYSGELLVCNRSDGNNTYSFNEYCKIARDVGYSIVEENVAPDNEEMTGAKERYLLVLQK